MNYFAHEKAIVDSKAAIGEKTRIWAFTNIQGGASVGKECNICDGCFIEKGAVVGDYVTIKHNVSIFDGVTLEDNVFCGSNIAFINDRYPRSLPRRKWKLEKTLVKKGATLGSNSTILCGVTIGEYAVVAAGSVVTKDISSYTIVGGNPARLLGYACECGQRLPDDLKCECGKKYILEAKRIKPHA